MTTRVPDSMLIAPTGSNTDAVSHTELSAAIASAKDRTQQTGVDSSDNVLYQGQSLTQVLTAMQSQIAGASPSAPQITTAPTISGTAALGQTLTATLGTVTGPTSTTQLQWTANDVAIPGALFPSTTLTFALQLQSLVGQVIGVTQIVTSSTATGSLVATRKSATTAAVSTTLASSVSCTLTTTGSQVAGSVLSATASATGASTYQFFWFKGGALIFTSTQSATLPSTYTTTSSDVGTITVGVIAYNSFGSPHASTPTMASGTATVTGAAPTVAPQSAPGWPTNLYLDVQATLPLATYLVNGVATPIDQDGSGNPLIVHNFFLSGSATAYRSNNTALLFTARSSEGVAVSSTIAYDEYVTIGGVQYGPFRSSTKTVAAAPATLAFTLSSVALAGYVFTASQAISTTTIGTISGGTGPFTVTLSGSSTPPLPATLAASVVSGTPTTVQLAGTPGSSAALRSISIVITDSAGASTAAQQFNVTVNAAGVTPLPAIPWSDMTTLITDSSGSGVTASFDGTTAISVASVVRMQGVANPRSGGDGRLVTLRRIGGTVGSSSVPSQRTESLAINKAAYLFLPGSPIWLGFAGMAKPGEDLAVSGPDDTFLWQQSHTPLSGNTQPGESVNRTRQANTVRIDSSYQTAAPVGETTSTQATTHIYTKPLTASGVWDKWALRICPGWGVAGQNTRLQMWNVEGASDSFTLVYDGTAPNTYNNGGVDLNSEYPRIGPYFPQGNIWNQAQLAMYTTPLYFARESNGGSLAAAIAALSGL